MRLKVQDILETNYIQYRIIELKDKAITVEDVIEYSKENINPEEICKTIIVRRKRDYYALFLKGVDKIDFKKLKKVIGKASIASLDEMRSRAGVDPGSVCPLLLLMPTIVDKQILELDRLNFGSGHHLYGIEISSKDLARVLDYLLADITEQMQ